MRISDWSSDVCSSDLIGSFQSVPPFVWLANPYQNNGVTLLQYRTSNPADAPFSSDPYNQNVPSGGTGSSGGLLIDSMDRDFKRSEERRVGKEGVSLCRSRGLTDH